MNVNRTMSPPTSLSQLSQEFAVAYSKATAALKRAEEEGDSGAAEDAIRRFTEETGRVVIGWQKQDIDVTTLCDREPKTVEHWFIDVAPAPQELPWPRESWWARLRTWIGGVMRRGTT